MTQKNSAMTPKSPKSIKTSENLAVLMKKDENSDNLIIDESEKQVTRDGTSDTISKAKDTTLIITSSPPITTIARPTDVEEKEKTDSPTTGKAGEERPDVHLQCQITAILMMSYCNDVPTFSSH